MWDELVCPFDRSALDPAPNRLSCTECGREFPIVNQLPVFADNEHHLASAGRRDDSVWASRADGRRRALEIKTLLSRFVSLGPESRVLLVGPGAGVDLRYLHGRRYAVDPLAGSRLRPGRLGRNSPRWIAARGDALPFASGSCDAVLLADVLEWTDVPQRVLAEATRVLADDGALWLSSRVAVGNRPLPFGVPRTISPIEITRGRLLHDCRAAGLTPLWTPASNEHSTGDHEVLPFGRHARFEGIFGIKTTSLAACAALPFLAAA